MTGRPTFALAALAACLAVSGCGGDTSSGDDVERAEPAPSPASSPAPVSEAPDDGEDELRTAVEAYSTAFLSGDAEGAHELLSERCKERLPVEALRGITASARDTYGRQRIESLAVDDLSGDLARVTYTYSVPVINQMKEPWTREDGKWRQDDC